MAPEASVHDGESEPGMALPADGEPAVQPQVAANGSNGNADEPLGLMPPPAVAAQEADQEGRARTGFFGRRSLFR